MEYANIPLAVRQKSDFKIAWETEQETVDRRAALLSQFNSVNCEACDAGYRLADDGLHYNDARGGATWGVCRKVVAIDRNGG